jgi:hypothetical protein
MFSGNAATVRHSTSLSRTHWPVFRTARRRMTGCPSAPRLPSKSWHCARTTAHRLRSSKRRDQPSSANGNRRQVASSSIIWVPSCIGGT